MFPSFPYEKHGFHCQFLFSKLCLRYTAGNFNENPSMRALAKILRVRVSEQSSNFLRAIQTKAKFCEHFEIGWDHSIPLLFVICFSVMSCDLIARDGFYFSEKQLGQNTLRNQISPQIRRFHVISNCEVDTVSEINAFLDCYYLSLSFFFVALPRKLASINFC